MDLRDWLDSENALHLLNCCLVEDFVRLDPLILEVLLGREELGDTVTALRPDVLVAIVHELVGPPLVGEVPVAALVDARDDLAADLFRLQVGDADRAVLADTQQVAAAVGVFLLPSPLVGDVQLGDWASVVCVNEGRGLYLALHGLEFILYLLEERHDEDAPVVCTYQLRRALFVCEESI